MATLFKTTATIAKDAQAGTVTIPTQGRSIIGAALLIPTVTGVITLKFRHVDSDATLYTWSPTGMSAKGAGTYICYAAEEATAPKPLEGVPTTGDGVECAISSNAGEAAARTFTVWVWTT